MTHLHTHTLWIVGVPESRYPYTVFDDPDAATAHYNELIARLPGQRISLRRINAHTAFDLAQIVQDTRLATMPLPSNPLPPGNTRDAAEKQRPIPPQGNPGLGPVPPGTDTSATNESTRNSAANGPTHRPAPPLSTR